MPKGYRHLTYEDRCQICALKTRGDSIRSIAEQTGFPSSTVSRGISRNSGLRDYRYKQAQGFAEELRDRKCNRRGRDGSGRGVIPGRVDISERPAVVEGKGRVGDWEADTIIGGGHKGALVSLVDRNSKYAFLRQVPAKSAAVVEAAVLQCLAPVPALVHAITADNGKEFARHRSIGEALSAGFFFSTPYHSWERGLNEHANGLARQCFPKSMDPRTLDPAEVRRVQDLPNNRPRRVPGFGTPAEVFQQALDAAEPVRPSG